jgi:hypothetical protein
VDDALGRIFDLTAMVAFLFVALRFDWTIKLLSYGKAHEEDFSKPTRSIMRLLAAFCALSLFAYLVKSIFDGAGPH